MAGMDWFRWHHGSVTDPKFQLIARKTKSRVSDVIAVWAFLLEAASQADERGNPGAQDFEAIDCALGLDDGQAEAIHASMIDRGIVESGGVIAKWETRQPKREREGDSSTERSRASRARKNQQEPQEANLGDATPCNTMQRQETPRVEESREEKKKDINSGARGSRLPENFEPDFQFATENGVVNTLEEASKFRDYWNSIPGQKGVKTDWPATWRNWCRNAKPAFKSPRQPMSPINRQEALEARNRAVADELIAEFNAKQGAENATV